MILAGIIGLLVSIISTYGFSIIVEYAVIKHVMDDPVRGLIASIVLGWVLTVMWQAYVWGVGPLALAFNLGGLVGALALAYPGIRRRRRADASSVENIFD